MSRGRRDLRDFGSGGQVPRWSSEGALVEQPSLDAQHNRPVQNPVVGQRVPLPRDPVTGLLIVNRDLALVRTHGANVTMWQVTLPPVTTAGFTAETPMPVAPNPAALSNSAGATQLRMTWGAGGITHRDVIEYPLGGQTFTVTSATLELIARANDGFAVYTASNTPVVGAWVVPAMSAQPLPLVENQGDTASGVLRNLNAFVRALWISSPSAGWTNTVLTFENMLGAVLVTIRLFGNEGRFVRVPVPAGRFITSWRAVTDDASAVSVIAEKVYG